MMKNLVIVGSLVLAVSAVAEVKPLPGPWLKAGETLVCFGDSITYGDYYITPLTEALGRRGVNVVNAGLGGDKTPMALTRIKDVAGLKPDAVLFFFGANDAHVGRGRWRDEPTVDPIAYRDNLLWMIHYFRLNTNVRKFSIVAPPCCCEGEPIAEFGEVGAPYRLMAREAADRANAVLVPLDTEFDWAFRAAAKDPSSFLLTRDGVHFNDRGSRLAADVMLRAWRMTDFPVTDYGAKADGDLCTAAFAKAVAECASFGGGRVVVPAGRYYTGPIHLKSGVELHLEKGAVIEFADDPKLCLPPVPSSWEGLECLNYSPFVYAYGCTNVAITGKGTIRAKMDFWRKLMDEKGTDIQGARAILYKWGSEDHPVEKRDITKAHPAIMRPQLIQFNRCKDVRIEDVRVEDSPFWTIHLFQSEDVVIRRIDVCAHGFNNDGVDIEMTRNVLVEDSTFDQGDDGFVFKSGRNRDAWRVGRPTENVEIRNCRLKTVASLVGVGSELSGGIRNVYVHDCTVEKACNLFYVKTNYRRGGFVENVRMENVRVDTVSQVLGVDTDVLYQWRKFPDYATKFTPISGLYMKNVWCGKARTGVNINGDARLPVRNVRVENVRIGRVQDFLSRVLHAENVDVSGIACDERGKVETPWDKDFDPTEIRSATK